MFPSLLHTYIKDDIFHGDEKKLAQYLSLLRIEDIILSSTSVILNEHGCVSL